MSIKQFSRLNYNIGNVIGEGTYTLTANTYTVNEGSTVNFSAATTGVIDGTTFYWTTTGTSSASDFVPAVSSGSFVVSNNSGNVPLTLSADVLTEGTETIVFQMRTGSISGTVVATASNVNISDTSVAAASPTYAIVPVGTTSGSTTVSQYKFVNLSTYAVDYTATASLTAQPVKLFRFSDFIIETYMAETRSYYVRNFKTNSLISNGTWSFTYTATCWDFVKFQDDKFGLLYKNANKYYMDTYTFNTSTGVISSKIATIDYGILSGSSDPGYEDATNPRPAAAASINIDTNSQITGYNGYIGFVSLWVDYYLGAGGANTYTSAWHIISINAAGTSGSLVSTTGVESSNPSRQISMSGYNGKIYLSTFDDNYYRIVNSSGTYDTSGTVSSNNYVTPAGYAPASVLGTNNWIAAQSASGTISLYLKTTTTSTVSTTVTKLTSIGDDAGFILQSAPNGCILIYNDSANVVKYIRYNGSTWTSPATITDLGSRTLNYNGSYGYHMIRCYNF